MKNVVIWIDKNDAVFFNQSASGMVEYLKLHSGKIDHHNGLKQDKKDKGERIFYQKILSHSHEYDSIVLWGPGIIKDQLKHFIEVESKLTFNKIKGVETSGDTIRSKELNDLAEKYFYLKS